MGAQYTGTQIRWVVREINKLLRQGLSIKDASQKVVKPYRGEFDDERTAKALEVAYCRNSTRRPRLANGEPTGRRGRRSKAQLEGAKAQKESRVKLCFAQPKQGGTADGIMWFENLDEAAKTIHANGKLEDYRFFEATEKLVSLKVETR